jgi:DNA-binding PadR family transcriptional regulator
VAKFTRSERSLEKSILSALSVKKIPDSEIIKEIEQQTNKRIGRRSIYDLRQSIKKESYHWYKTMRTSQYEYIHEFMERINEIMSLQKKNHQIIDSNEDNPQIQQTS